MSKPNETPLDGSVGGALDVDPTKAGELDPESTENLDDNRAQAVNLKPSPELDSKIMNAIEKIIGYKSERSAINSKISALIEDLEAEGINRHAFRLALRYYEMPEEQRSGLDFSYTVARKASGYPVQAALDLVIDNTQNESDGD